MDGLHHSHGSRLPGQEVDRDPVRNRRPIRLAHRGRPARPILLTVRRPGRRPPPCRPPARAGCRAGRAPAVGRGVRRWSRPVEALAEVGAAPLPVVLQQLPRDRPRRGAVLHGQGLGHRGERVRADELEELDHLQSHPPLLRRDAVDEPAHRPVAAARGDETHCPSCASACRFRQETCRAAKPEGRTESRSCRSPRLASWDKPETTREECPNGRGHRDAQGRANARRSSSAGSTGPRGARVPGLQRLGTQHCHRRRFAHRRPACGLQSNCLASQANPYNSLRW
jgi:hypothetical protein